MALADAEMQMLKRDADLRNIDEIMEEIAREAKNRQKNKVDQELENLKQKASADFDPEATAAKLRKKFKINQDVGKIQERAIKQQ